MTDMTESQIAAIFHERVSRQDIDGIRVTFRVSGGMPRAQRIDRAVLIGSPVAEAESALSRNELQAVLTGIDAGVRDFFPRSEAKFLPDSRIGSITIDVDGNAATFFFLADEDDRITQGHRISDAAAEALRQLAHLSTEGR